MKNSILFILLLNFCVFATAQKIIELPYEKPDHVTWKGAEKEYFSEIWTNQVVTNVSTPTLAVYKPKADINTGMYEIYGKFRPTAVHS